MFEEIRIENLGVIAAARLPLGPGLTAITGETGAGKTMVLTGLGLLLGAKADASTVRLGEDSAAVEGRVLLAPGASPLERAREAGAEPDDDGSLVLVRTISGGRSRAVVGGRSVPQAVLGEIAAELVTVHGQAEQARLRTPSRQRLALDEFAGAEHLARLAEHRETWAERARVSEELDTLLAEASERAREAELLRLGLGQIERVDPQPGEDVELAALATRLANTEDLRTGVTLAHAALVGDDDAEALGAAAAVETARRALEQAAVHDPALEEHVRRVQEIGYLVADLATELSSYAQDVQADPARLEQVESRRAELGRLTRSFGPDVDAVLAWSRTAAERLVELDGGSERVDGLRERLAVLDERLAALREQVTHGRRAAASRLGEVVTAELAGLAMDGARLEVVVEDEEPGPWGADAVEMRLASHEGAPARPLGRSASGGELSRIMLALEVALATAEGSGAVRPATFVFDEVDAGVGGKAAVEVGRRLAELARSAQVIVVTHLAQVAAFADRHLVVARQDGSSDTVTESDVVPVEGPERVRELARMLSGQEDSEAARTHAAELLTLAGGR